MAWVTPGSAISVVAPYALPEKPSNPFAGSTGGGLTTWVYQILALVGEVVLLLPVVALVIWGIVNDQPTALWLALVVGTLWGYGAARIGATLGARQLDRRGPELLQSVTPRGI